MTKEDVLGLSFYPHECGGMIECVTRKDALRAMDDWNNHLQSELSAAKERIAELEKVLSWNGA